MKHKYPIHKDFRVLKFFRMPQNLFLLSLSNLMVRLFYSCQLTHKQIKKTRLRIKMRDGHFLKADLFSPKQNNDFLPCLMYYPGGAFLMNATHIHKKTIAKLVDKLQIKAVLVHYRLAPKYPFPTALYDAYDSLMYIYKANRLFQIDIKHFGIGGDSAGGNLAAAVTLMLKEEKKNIISSQMLIYPALDKGLSNPSRKLYTDTPMFHSRMFEVVGKHFYKNGLFGLERFAFPLQYPSFKKMPPTYLETAQFDPLHDDGKLYVDRLNEDHNIVIYNDTLGTVHGYDARVK
ncbi:MAG: alpha/beta hydrolase, partial [Firmicutes bacterium]|nr:alpha/beta hydrolase [Bacillota bacterium]